METELDALRRENSKLKVSLGGYSKDIELVRKENLYLRNVLANSKEISQLLRSINVNCGLPSTTPGSVNPGVKRQTSVDSCGTPKVAVDSVVPVPSVVNTYSDPCAPSADSASSHVARTAKRSFPIAADDVSLSLSAPEDEDDLDILFGKNVPADLDFNLNEASTDDTDYLGFGPNALGDWLDGDEPLADIGVCLHVAKNKVSLEFCASCNENAFSSWSGAPLLCSLEGLQFYLPIAEAYVEVRFVPFTI
ncbi:hypothetical protein ONE63_002126 [Megalurothrips usitatus]|uniref:Uncharacterized protein n=1 Tax=Megalurothrips usitatus TaxID=439358 RepID=A0AAV7XF45_9NEOP|nr:hypothetical protein ONE63_002126 [Megalurothrips usitatus]